MYSLKIYIGSNYQNKLGKIMSVLDWERQFKKPKKKELTFPKKQALFIQILAKFGPIDSKSEFKARITEAGLTEREYSEIYDILKHRHIMKYNIGEPKGWYIEPEIIDIVGREYPDPIIINEFSSVKDNQKSHISHSGIDAYVIFESKNQALSMECQESNDEIDYSDDDGFPMLTREQLRKILKEWEEKQENI